MNNSLKSFLLAASVITPAIAITNLTKPAQQETLEQLTLDLPVNTAPVTIEQPYQQPIFEKETTQPETIQPKPQVQPEIFHGEIPVYSLKTVPPNYCARYARLSAEELFNKRYTPNNAWDMKYDDKVIKTLDKDNWMESTRALVEEGKIKPGMIAGFHYPRSRHLGKKDKRGNTIECTHVGVYLGTIQSGEPIFAEEWGKRTQKTSLSQFAERKMRITEFLDAKSK